MNKKENWNSVRTVRGLMNSNSDGLSHFPKMVESLIDNKAWMDFTTPQGDEFVYTKWQFRDFIAAKPEAGLGAEETKLLGLCKGTPAYDKIQKLLKSKRGPKPKNNKRDNVTEIRGGNSLVGAFRTLDKRPDLKKKVIAGELSANAAMIQAGFRKPMASVPKTKEGFVAYIKRTFTTAEIRWIKDQL